MNTGTKRVLHARDTGLHLVTDSFEGPFEVVLDLIDRKKLSINELSLAQITDEYIEHVRSSQQFPMEDAAEFISVAATLLVIKSKSLIPDLELSEDEETDVMEFERRLREYERFRGLTRELSQLFGKKILISAGERPREAFFAPSRDLSLAQIQSTLAELLKEAPPEPVLPEARVRNTITLEEMMERLLDRVQKKISMSFHEFAAGSKERVEVIVSFLALLELVKQGNVDAEQGTVFGDIHIRNTTTGVPKYG